ncbi:hypothetical protein ES703_36105 [subsurface metagenome]
MSEFPNHGCCLVLFIKRIFDAPGVLSRFVIFVRTIVENGEVPIGMATCIMLYFEVARCVFFMLVDKGKLIMLSPHTPHHLSCDATNLNDFGCLSA